MGGNIRGVLRFSSCGVLTKRTLYNQSHPSTRAQNRVRTEGGIPPLVALLEAWDIKVQRAGAGALRTLAFKNEENKRQIVECGGLPLLIQVGGSRGGKAAVKQLGRQPAVAL